VIIVRNSDWQSGQSGSLKAGVTELARHGSMPFIFLLCDKPQITTDILQKIITASYNDQVDIVAMSVNGKFNPPVLFKPQCIERLLELKGDEGGKRLVKTFRTKYVEVTDSRFLLDADTEEDYQRLIQSFMN
jgi:molybdenum cofactor cytidylyltransferase